MNHTTQTVTLHTEEVCPDLLEVAEGISEQLAAEGFEPGLPATVKPETFAADKRSYARAACPECGHRGQHVEPYRRPSGQGYRLALSCKRCFHEQVA